MALADTILAVIILSVALLTLVSGLFTLTIGSVVSQDRARAFAAAESVAEAMRSPEFPYIPCGGPAAYEAAYLASSAISNYDVPASFTLDVVAVHYLQLNYTTPTLSTFSASCVADGGAQKLLIRVSGVRAGSTDLEIVKLNPAITP